METQNVNENKRKSGVSQTVLLGLLALVAGAVLLMRNFGLLSSEYSRILFSWPMLIIVVGLFNLYGKSKMWGVVLILIGGFFLGTKFFGLDYSFGQIFWPSIIILIGLFLIFNAGKFWGKNRLTVMSSKDDVLEDVAVFGGVEKNVVSESFRGGETVAVFGGSKINLMQAKLAPGINTLEMVAIFGGVSLIVPSDWNIKIEVVSILGGFSDKRYVSQVDETKTLVIKGVAIFGGGEIKNV